MSNKLKTFWLSFCDTDLPEGQKFLGCVITRACTIVMALEKAHILGINPGGEVGFIEVPKKFASHIHENDYDKLMSKEYLLAREYIDNEA